MIPPLIVEEAVNKGIDIIAISDHNASANIRAVMEAASGTSLTVLPAMELQTVEEVHILCLFDEIDQVLQLQEAVDVSLDEENSIEFFGEQFLVDKTGEFLAREERLLLTSTQLSLNDAWDIVVGQLGGLFIPAHVNRKAFGLFQVLGFIPDDIPLDILEINSQITHAKALEAFPALTNRFVIQDGDAHFLEDIRGLNQLTLNHPSINEISQAIRGENGRTHHILPLSQANQTVN